MIPAIDHKGKIIPEFVDWLEFAEQVMACWLEAAEPGPGNVCLSRADRRRLPSVGFPRPLEGRAGGAPRVGQGVEEAIEEVEGTGLTPCR